jgi:hypothetical protein
MSETIKLGDTVRFQATLVHPFSGYLVAADSGVRYYAYINDNESPATQGDMVARSGFTGSYRGSFSVSPGTFASGQYVSIKASGRVSGYTGWGNIKDFIVSDICLANIVQWSGVNSHPDDVGTKVWNYGNNPMSRMVDIYSIGMRANAASALGVYWDCVAVHSYPAAGGTSNTITLNSLDSYSVDNIASGCKIKISAGVGEGQYRTIVGLVTSPYKVATVSEPWITIPQSGFSSYTIYDGESNQRYNPPDLYYANIKYTRKNVTGAWQDNFSTQWYKNGSVVTSGQLTNPRLSVYNTVDGSVLLNGVAMSYSSPILGSTYYSSSNPTVTNSGIPYMVAISGTIDGQMRQWNQIIGIDLL